jgi:hypothetical protein
MAKKRKKSKIKKGSTAKTARAAVSGSKVKSRKTTRASYKAKRTKPEVGGGR